MRLDQQEFQEFLNKNQGKIFTIEQLQQQRRENRLPEVNVANFLALIRYTNRVRRDYRRRDGQLESVFQII
ncbi:hypothetical protein [Enterococcus casseliflavus]|uniref:hypothetical protein n=1 Tax=Enterococcus casseliflavus TaxID=37734 RepID=UPI0003541C08|nr:hypothetical protein [Enterococcus casseliflavus]EPH88483.1 hypothetical protein D922_03972 [Enterococcus faecalis 06-MB-DW-09]MDB1688314.1 hypothetical protein [Enterococcus casseliflavus]